MPDYTDIWKELNAGKHVLLLIDSQGDDAYFNAKVAGVRKWFTKIVKSDLGALDLIMQNNAFLCMRKLTTMPAYPFKPEDSGVKVMWLKYGNDID